MKKSGKRMIAEVVNESLRLVSAARITLEMNQLKDLPKGRSVAYGCRCVSPLDLALSSRKYAAQIGPKVCQFRTGDLLRPLTIDRTNRIAKAWRVSPKCRPGRVETPKVLKTFQRMFFGGKIPALEAPYGAFNFDLVIGST